jgi:hypothetical protein
MMKSTWTWAGGDPAERLQEKDSKMISPETAGVVSTRDMRGEDEEETRLLQGLAKRAEEFLLSQRWCQAVQDSYLGLGVAGFVGVFLVRIAADKGVDEWLWTVVGDLPSCYLVTDETLDAVSALEVYCELMDDWIKWVRAGGVGEKPFPVSGPTTPEWADKLEARIEVLRTTVIPTFRAPKPSQ